MARKRPKGAGRKAEVAAAAEPRLRTKFAPRDLWICAALAAAVFAAYSSVAGHTFLLLDDLDYVPQNPHVAAGLTGSGIAWALTSFHAGNWFPLTWLSLMLDCQLFGVNAGASALVNVLLHALNSALLFAVLRRAGGSRWPSALVAALFAIHPQHVESVAWVAERKDVLCALFWLATMWAYLRYAERPSRRRYALVAAGAALALLSKPMAVTLPLTLLLLDIWPLRRIRFGEPRETAEHPRPAAMVREKIPLFALSLAAAGVTFFAQRASQYVMSLNMIPASTRVANALFSWLAYVAQMLWPLRLAVIYPYPLSIPAWQPLAGGAFITIVSILALRALRWRPYVTVGWFWYLATLVPVIGFAQVGSQARADRYMYVPSIGLFFILAWGARDLIHRWPRARTAIAGVCAAACAACLALTWVQVRYWKNTETLFRHSLSVTRDDYYGHWILARALQEKGLYGEAISNLYESTRIYPGFVDAHRDLSNLLIAQGRPNEAIAEFQAAVGLDPEDEKAQYDLGTTLAQEGRFEEALGPLRAAVRLKPDYVKARMNLGSVLANLGRIDEAIAEYSAVLRLAPDFQGAREALEYAREVKGSVGGGK